MRTQFGAGRSKMGTELVAICGDKQRQKFALLLFDGNGLRQIARLINVAAAAHCNVIGEQL